MNYIDEIYEQMLARSQGRSPASIQDPNAVLAPLGAQMPVASEPTQKSTPIVIEGSSDFDPVEIPPGYKMQMPQSNIILENRNTAIRDLQRGKSDLEKNIQAISEEAVADRRDVRSALENMKSIDFEQYSNPELDQMIKAQQMKVVKSPDELPKQDMTTEMILRLGPALGSMFLGEAGAQAAPVAFKQGLDYSEQSRKDAIERIKLLKENADKRLSALTGLRKSGQESFDKSQERRLKKALYELEGAKDLSKQSMQDLQKTEARADALSQEISRQIGDTSTDISKMELEREKLDAAQKRANTMAGGQVLKDATTLRKEFYARPEVKNFSDIEQSYNKISEVAKKPTAAGDLSLIFSYMKMLDPGSVVREGEFATAEKAAGVPEQVRNIYNKIITGQKLSPSQRQDFIQRAADVYTSQQKIVSQIEKEYKGYAGAYGTSPNLVIGRPSKEIKTEPHYKDGDTVNYKGKTMVRKGGVWVPKK